MMAAASPALADAAPFTPDGKTRCAWPRSVIATRYHDEEWGVPLADERKLFEFLVLDAAQAGLSWEIILRKREGYRAAFDNFDPAKVARYNEKRVEQLLGDARIVRNRLKVQSAISNAQAFLRVQDRCGSFAGYIWQFVDGAPKINCRRSHKMIPARTPQSDAMSKALIKQGFRFVGSTICYAFMQAAGMVNDHTAGCFRHAPLSTQMRGWRIRCSTIE